MKRLLTSITILLLVALMSVTVFSAADTFELSDLKLKVSIPSGYSVITRDTPAKDPIFDELGTTKSALISQFEKSNIYLNAISNTDNEEIVVTMMENNLSNFSLLSDTVLNTFASMLADQYVDYGINVSKYDIYQHSQAKFIRVYFTDTAKTVHGLQYYTIYDGKAMNFTMRSYTGTLSPRQESAIKTVVDSIKYDNAPPTLDSGEDTEPFTHADTDSGVIFTVPANWKQEAFTKDREFIDAKFVSTKDEGCIIIFGSTDFWEELPTYDRVGKSRSDMNNSMFTKSDIAELYNTTADRISVVTYNGVQYYQGEVTGSSDVYGLDFSVTMTELVHINNGWMYTFQFGGTNDHKLYPEFESLLNSVQYPAASNVSGVGSTNNTPSGAEPMVDSSGIVTVITFVLIIAVIVVAAVITRRKSYEKDIQASYTPVYNAATSQPLNNPQMTAPCKNCGQALPLDSAFCHVCGTKIMKE